MQFTRRELGVAVFAAVTAFCAYTAIFSFRKAFNVGAFGGYAIWGMDYKTVLVVSQVFGYMLSKFYGIRFIAAMQRKNRHWLILGLTGVAWLAWALFAVVPPPHNWWCLFLNGFPLGMLWGVVFSYIEGRRTTDMISAALAVSFIFASGLAKSVAQWVMEGWGVSEYGMPFVVGCVFMPVLIVFVLLLEKIPPPGPADRKQRMERLPMSAAERRGLLRRFWPGIALLVVIYILVTILREVRDSFMADMWRASGEPFQPGVFAGTESLISLIILVLIAAMSWLNHNFRAFIVTQWIMLAGFAITLCGAMLFSAGHLGMYAWMLLAGLGLYMVYIPFNSLLFDRFIAAFRFTGNVGFLIYIADAFGYLGSVGVMLAKSVFQLQLNWLEFYTGLVKIAGVTGLAGTVAAMYWFRRKYRKSAPLLQQPDQQ
ncbi:DUF5690 family protein [Chitinophaga caseinilytica]|uniref:DUF5690 family protein n=1 Tax=Chitinophaga caseinilytica TaxID=2267521 RepID=UPI003C30B8A7